MHVVPSPTRSPPLMQQKHHHRRHFRYIKSIIICHVCMNIWLKQQCIYSHRQFTTSSPLFSLYAFTNNIIINNHICIHQHRLHHIIQQLHTISHNPSKGENTSRYDKHHIQHLEIILTFPYNHIKLYTKGLQSIRP